ncbi:hypothetical protein niasHS_004517 [Heterodera schachtii]|uniref:BTB domain-containing protein n=1 Tax=Heterodera schachtii TaxID=97005 RepID=A0ABD2JMG6_HETSC
MDKLANRMKRLLSTGVDADVHFLVGQGDKQEVLPAHKPILRVASEVFDAMFRYDEKFPVSVTQNPTDEKAFPKEVNSPVEIADVDVEAFKAMLNFIYTDDLSGVNGNNAIDVLYAAKKYNLPLLVRECVKIPIEELSNVFIAFAKARLLEEKNAHNLIGSDEFLQIDQQLLCELLGRNQLVLRKEYWIWVYALRWATEQCRQNGIECSAKNYRQMLGPALFKIRFPIIYKPFMAGIASSGVLTSDELVSVFLCHCYYSSSSIKSLAALNGGATSELYPLKFSVNKRSTKCKGKLSLKIEKFSEFARQKELSRKYSDAVYINGFQWKIFAQIQLKSGTKYLGFFIQCKADDYGSDWSCTCSATLSVIPQYEETEDFNDSSKTIYQSFWPKDKDCWGFSEFMAFEKLMDPDALWYNKEMDTVTLSTDVDIDLMDPSKGLYDKDADKVTLAIDFTVEGKKGTKRKIGR